MDYNEFRPHDSLGDKTPMEFMPRTLKQESLVLNCLPDGGAYELPVSQFLQLTLLLPLFSKASKK
jgi:hypothetical protein